MSSPRWDPTGSGVLSETKFMEFGEESSPLDGSQPFQPSLPHLSNNTINNNRNTQEQQTHLEY